MAIYTLGGATPEFPADSEFWVAPNACLIGLVRLRSRASVWFGAVLRGDNDWIEVGENSNVQDNSVIHTDPGQPVTIGANVTIGHNVILHSATVGDNTLIGMGSTILSGARIGPNCIVGANALITENKEIPANSLVLGQPARVVRQLDDAQRILILQSAQIYVKNYQRFRAELQELNRGGIVCGRRQLAARSFGSERQSLRMRASASGPKLNQAVLSLLASTTNNISSLPSWGVSRLRTALTVSWLDSSQT
jgi:carbonic anhydrase/acetyltransferase-like protein (isoleucine patch superfamily)